MCCSSSSSVADGSGSLGHRSSARAWVTQQARNVAGDLDHEGIEVKFLLRDRDTKYVANFDTVLTGAGAHVLRTPFRTPNANAHAERFVRTVRSECLDHLLIVHTIWSEFFAAICGTTTAVVLTKASPRRSQKHQHRPSRWLDVHHFTRDTASTGAICREFAVVTASADSSTSTSLWHVGQDRGFGPYAIFLAKKVGRTVWGLDTTRAFDRLRVMPRRGRGT